MRRNCDECTFLNCDPVCISRQTNRAHRKGSRIGGGLRLTEFVTGMAIAITLQALFSSFTAINACGYFYSGRVIRAWGYALFGIRCAISANAFPMEHIYATCRDQSSAEKCRQVGEIAEQGEPESDRPDETRIAQWRNDHR